MKNRKIIILRIFIIILILIWMNMVFGFSAQNSSESSSLSMWVASLITNDMDLQEVLEPYIRKIAHFSEYGAGGVLFFSLFSTFNLKDEKKLIFAIGVGFLYSVSDEIHQLFVDGRSGQIKDVYIDTLGVITGALIMCFIINLVKKIYFIKNTKINK